MSLPVVIPLFCALAVLAGGCSRTPDSSNQPPASTGTPAPAAPADAPRPAADPPAGDRPQAITGPVAETMDAGTYTYVRVKAGSEDVWAATNRFAVKVGDRVTVPLEMPMSNFHSKALNRDFPLIYFASAIVREGEPLPAASPDSSAGAGPVAPMQSHGTAAPDPGPVERLPAAAGVTPIEQVWATRSALKGKTVTVQGKVVKYNGNILGVNWLHIQDGTGEAGAKTNDLAVTTSDAARVGDVVTATGTVAVDKDFGAGYAYPVIVEGAVLKKR